MNRFHLVLLFIIVTLLRPSSTVTGDMFSSFFSSLFIRKNSKPDPPDNRIELSAVNDDTDYGVNITFNAETNQLPSTAFEIFAPAEYQIRAVCQIQQMAADDGSTAGKKQVLYVERERTTDHSDGKAFTGDGSTIEETSLFNYMRIQLKSDKGEFWCHVSAFKADCDCGWGRQVVCIDFSSV